MHILIGTTNASKVTLFRELLANTGATLVTPRDLHIDEEPQETGKTPEENARIKAAFYGRFAERVICADSGLYVDALPLSDPRQPGLHIRTPHGVRLDDEQMIAHYAALSRALGGRVLAYYLDACAVQSPKGRFSFQATREEARAAGFYILDTPCAQRREGWPIDSLSVDLQGRSFFDPSYSALPQMKRPYLARLNAFLRESLELDKAE